MQVKIFINLCLDFVQAAEAGKPPERTSRFYAKGALQYLVPILLDSLTKQVRYKRLNLYTCLVDSTASKYD